jgi:hypothetical protein
VISLRLGLRLLRGAGREGALRLALLLLGVAVGGAAVLFALAVPRALSAEGERALARVPVPITDPQQTPAFRYALAEDEHDERIWTHLLIADMEAVAPAPPGIPRMPSGSDMYASPEVVKLLTDTPSLRPPGIERVLPIAADGLKHPDELYDIRPVLPEQLPGGGTPGAGFGATGTSLAYSGVSSKHALLELALLVGLPGALYLSVCAQLSSATRRRRLAALRLMGMEPSTVARAAAVESGAVGVAGGALAVIVYAAALPWVAEGGALGFRWFPADSTLSLTAAGATVACMTLVAARLGTIGVRRTLATALNARREPEPAISSPWRLLPLVVGAAMLLPLALGPLVDPDRRLQAGAGTVQLQIGAALAVAGLVASSKVMTTSVSRLFLRRDPGLATRLGVRRLLFEPGSAFRVLTGLVVLVLVASIGAAVLRDARLAAGREGTTQVASVAGADVATAAERESVRTVAADARLSQVRATIAAGTDTGLPPDHPAVALGVDIVYASCSDFLRLVGRSDVDGCLDDAAYVLADTDGAQVGLPPGTMLDLVGATASLPVPERHLRVPDLFETPLPELTILVTRPSGPASGWPTATQFVFLLGAERSAVDRFTSDVRLIAPAAGVDVSGRNLEALSNYRVHRGIIMLGLGLGFLLGILAFIVAAVDRALERRSNVAALIVVGVPAAILRRSQAVQLLLPLAIALATAIAVGQLISTAYLSAGGLQSGFYAGGLWMSGAMVFVGTVLALVSSRVVVGRSLRTEHLRRE